MIKVYWASSLHSKEIRENNELYAKELESYGYEVLLPQRHGVWEKMLAELKEAEPHLSDAECIRRVKQKCIDMDMVDVEMCDICIINCPRIPSEGAIFEASYCFAKGKPVYMLCPDDEIFRDINLMLTYSFKRIRTVGEMYTEYEVIMKSRPTVLLLLSGGMDSTVLLAYYLSKGYNVNTISIDYGQTHVTECLYAEKIAGHYKVNHRHIELDKIFNMIPSALTGNGTYKDASYADGGMMEVPMRNTIMLSIIAGIAKSNNIGIIAYAAHVDMSGNESVYPDCTTAFLNAIDKVMEIQGIKVEAPFLKDRMTKADIAELGVRLGVDFNMTYSCYHGGKKPCGKCATCIEREQALKMVGVL